MKLTHIIPKPVRSLLWRTHIDFLRQVRLNTASWRKLPDFLCIGAQKSGSSTLYWWLHQHPQLSMSFDKESKFFDRHYHKGVKWYRHQFPLNSSKKLAGDNTPYYLFHPLVPERVHELCPDAKVIMVLRNPIDRAYSQYQMECRKGREVHGSFERAIEGELERIDKAKNDLLADPLGYHHTFENTSYLSRGIYIDQIEHWLQWFERDKLLILENEHFYNSPKESLGEVYDFLGIEHVTPTDWRSYNVINYAPMKGSTREELNAFFRPHNERLERFLGKELNWK